MLLLVILHLLGSFIRLSYGDVYYQIPNPFEESQHGFYAIKSLETVISSDHKSRQSQVTEYFSLGNGISYSLHQDRADETIAYALIGDGPRGRSYVIRNPWANIDDGDELDCELDHTHHQRQVFPYQYSYQNYRATVDKKTSDRWFVYGVGAIWLNAIERKIVSNEVALDGQSPSVWVMREGDLEIKLLFNLEESLKDAPEQQVFDRIKHSKLNHIGISRKVAIESIIAYGGSTVVSSSREEIEIQSFEVDVDPNFGLMMRFLSHLDVCRHRTYDYKGQRVFPSLMRAVSMSPDRLYHIGYLEQKFNSFKENSPPEGKFSEKHHRNLHDAEVHTEWFSFEKEMQVNIYEGFPNYPDPKGEIHVFMKHFTGRESKRSSRHSTVHYHLIESEENHSLISCKPGEEDPPPTDQLHLLLRPIHFKRSSNGIELIGTLTGLGALLMNAADLHYKQFNLFKRYLNVPYDLNNLEARKRVQVDEWQLQDRKSKNRVVHFYFNKKLHHEEQTVEDLVRIEVRSARRESSDLEVVEPADDVADADEPNLDQDLLIRWDILRIETQATETTKNFIFTIPLICGDGPKPDLDDKNDDDDHKDKDYIAEPEEEFEKDHYHEFPDWDLEESEDQKEAQKDGEEFEMERPGQLVEDVQVPDFWNSIQGANGYELHSIVKLLQNKDQQEEAMKPIYLSEQMDLQNNLAHLAVYTSPGRMSLDKPNLEYFINYNARMMFQVDQTGNCKQVEQPESWLRLFSTKLTYFRANDDHSVVEEEDKLRMYGVAALWRQAAESDRTEFLGGLKNLVSDSNGHQYKELIWSLAEDGDQNMRFKLKFWLRKHENKSQEETALDEAKRPIIFESIYVDRLMEDNGEKDYKGGFKRFKVDLAYLDTSTKTLTLPQTCREVLTAASKVDSFANVNFPSFSTAYSFRTYRALYKVTTAPKYMLDTGSKNTQHRLSVTQILESFDSNMNLGHLVIGNGPGTKEVFIDGNKKLMYLFSGGLCKPIHSLKGLVDEDSNFLESNEEFSLDKMYGLAALWIRLTKMSYTLKTKVQHDESGNPIERHIYRSDGESKTIKFSVEANFIVRGPSNDRRFELESIDFLPERWRSDKNQVELHRTNIKVEFINNDYSARNWQLPDVCVNDSTGTPKEVKFPKWKDLIGVTGQFYARSELTASVGHLIEGRKIYLMDEWFHNDDLRLKSYSLRQNFDFLIYTKTGESFDISTRYRCPNELARLKENSQEVENSLLKFWTTEEVKLESLGELYYSPMALWRLADSSSVNVKFSNYSLELAPKPKTSNLSKLDAIERELSESTWKVSHPQGLWSYDMSFKQLSMVDSNGQLLQWFVLTRITVRDSMTIEYGSKPVIDIDLVNYRYQHDVYDWKDTFLLPEGYGCRRSKHVEEVLAQTKDSLFLNPKLAHYIWYEAAFERVIKSDDSPALESESVVSKSVLPTVMGTLFKAPAKEQEPHLNVWVHYVSTRFLNGTKVSTRTVHDQGSGLSFEIDRNTGYCKIGQEKDRFWTLEFPELELNQGSQVVEMDDTMFQRLINDQVNPQHPLNVYTHDGKMVTTYEEALSMMQLTNRLQRPATIIRRFEQSVENQAPTIGIDMQRNMRLHSSMSIEVMLFDEGRHVLEAVLNLNIRQATHVSLHQFTEVLDVSNCYNDGGTDNRIRTFTIEYQCSLAKRNIDSFDSALAEESFVTNFLSSAQILPTQLAGSPRMTFNHDKGIVAFTFNLLNAPALISLNSQFDLGKRMSPQWESFAEVRVSPTLRDCLRWCDDVGCLAMSYCLDYTCRIWVKLDILYNQSSLTNMSSNPLEDDPSCTYLRLSDKQPLTIDKFAGQMEYSLNSFDAESLKTKSLYKLNTGSYCRTLNPWRFYETLDNFDIPESPGDLEDPDEYSGVSYNIAGQNQLLKMSLFTNLTDFKSTLEHALSYSHCLETCKQVDCILVSYCSSDRFCSVVTGSGDLKQVEDFKETTADDLGCSISVKNLLDKYTLFKPTKEPVTYEQKLDDYSDLNCAAMCDAVNEFTCLSFDVCLARQPEGPPKPTCYLQSQHVIQDSFDRSILMPNPLGDEEASTSPNQGISCKHYSKSILADYKQIINRQFLAPNGKQTVKGNTAERCAHECQDDQKCYGFEHCFDSKSKPSQSCYFVRSSDNFKPDKLNHLYRYMQDQSAPSDKCSIYAIRHFPEEYGIDNNKPFAWVENTKGFLGRSKTHVTRLAPIMKVLYYVMGSVVVGLLIQLAYIKAVGRTLGP